MKPKLLCILHYSPPKHGASMVGDFIKESSNLKKNFDCHFIKIKSSETIGEIGRVKLRKLFYTIELYFKVLLELIFFRPEKIYYTPSVGTIAFYRDFFISTLWKFYSLFKDVDLYFHYHTKGISSLLKKSSLTFKIVSIFLKNSTIILLSVLLVDEYKKIKTNKKIVYLPNGVKDFLNISFNKYLEIKYSNINSSVVNILYMAHMIRDKGYWDLLNIVAEQKSRNIVFHFAGLWKDERDKREFFEFIKDRNLDGKVIYHGFVDGKKKEQLFRQSHIFVYPTKNEAFGLAIIEAFSYGIPVIASNEGSIPFIIDSNSGIIINTISELSLAINNGVKFLNNPKTAEYCRNRYLEYFSIESFEAKLIRILHE